MATVSAGLLRLPGCMAGVILNMRAIKFCMWIEMAFTTQVSPRLAVVTLKPCIHRIHLILGLGIHLHLILGLGFGRLHPFGRSRRHSCVSEGFDMIDPSSWSKHSLFHDRAHAGPLLLLPLLLLGACEFGSFLAAGVCEELLLLPPSPALSLVLRLFDSPLSFVQSS